MSCERDQEQKEISVVALANTIIHPWTVVVKGLKNIKKKDCISSHQKQIKFHWSKQTLSRRGEDLRLV